MAAVIAGAAASATAAAYSAFGYNRANYMFDNAQRFGRYNSGYGNAMAQAAMYREDIRDLTALTVTKQDTYHTIGIIFFVLNFQLIMAGRLGVHGPAPPGWLLGLYWGNICTSLMFLTTFTWLANHAAARATAGGAHMLTRSVRLPIPSPKQLDKARLTGNAFEKQRMTDMFRVPFVAPAPLDPTTEAGADPEMGKDKKNGARKEDPRRIPRWYHDECKELHGGAGQVRPSASDPPEHFELYRGLQQEWWAHESYSRIGMTFFISHWLNAASIYSQSHCFGELRALWPAWSVTMLFVTAHFAILRLDIVNHPSTRMYNFPIENFLPWYPMICVLGMTLEFSILTPSAGWKFIIYLLSWICFITHLLWALRLYDIAEPHKAPEMPEVPGQPWWPSEWPLPPALQNVTYLVAPPKRLEPGVTCLQQEMKAAKMKKSGGGGAPVKKAREVYPGLFPWRIFRGAIMTTTAMWVLICVGRIFEQINGERMFLKQEGRVERWPSHMQPWMPPWTREGTRNYWCHTGGCDRRLSQKGARRLSEVPYGYWREAAEAAELESAQAEGREHRLEMASAAQRLAAVLGPVAEALEGPLRPAPSNPAALYRAKVSWPSKLRPAFLAAASGDGLARLAALARDHRGAMVRVPREPAFWEVQAEPSSFVLRGTEGLGELLGASWGGSGLLVATASGALAECEGLPGADGFWACKQVAMPLPLGGSSLEAAAAARVPGSGRLRAAVAFKGDSSIVLFDEEDGAWLPAGEVQLPFPSNKVPNFSMSAAANELLISTGQGGALKWPVGQSEPAMAARPQASIALADTVWNAVCSLGSGHVAHLASRKTMDSTPPELFVTATVA